MNLDTLNLLIGIASLLLGLVAAFSAIKAMTSRALRAAFAGAGQWVTRREVENEMFAAHPSAFSAYLARCFLIGVFIFIAWRVASGVANARWQALVSFVAPVAIGLLLGAVSNRCSELLTHFRSRQGSRRGEKTS